jgi:hypothetical protein
MPFIGTPNREVALSIGLLWEEKSGFRSPQLDCPNIEERGFDSQSSTQVSLN